ALLDYSERMMQSVLRSIPDGAYRAVDFLDDDGISPAPLRIAVEIRVRGSRAEIDFTGSAPECQGNVNAVIAITESSVFYVFRCLVGEDVPATAGLMRPIRVIAPERTIVNAGPPRAVAGANVGTSQRIADVLLRALPGRIPAASQGTMNNFTFGGADTRPRRAGAPFAYYETIAGGMGARPDRDGMSGVHTNMTNSLNTPIEVLEISYPVRVHRYGLRRGSGGKGRFRGGDGVVREIEMLVDAQIGLLCERRTTAPYGLDGGAPGAKGVNEVIYPSARPGKPRGKGKRLPSKCSLYVPAGSAIRVSTPGGGGYGKTARKRGQEGRAQSS